MRRAGSCTCDGDRRRICRGCRDSRTTREKYERDCKPNEGDPKKANQSWPPYSQASPPLAVSSEDDHTVSNIGRVARFIECGRVRPCIEDGASHARARSVALVARPSCVCTCRELSGLSRPSPSVEAPTPVEAEFRAESPLGSPPVSFYAVALVLDASKRRTHRMRP